MAEEVPHDPPPMISTSRVMTLEEVAVAAITGMKTRIDQNIASTIEFVEAGEAELARKRGGSTYLNSLYRL